MLPQCNIIHKQNTQQIDTESLSGSGDKAKDFHTSCLGSTVGTEYISFAVQKCRYNSQSCINSVLSNATLSLQKHSQVTSDNQGSNFMWYVL